MPKKIIVILGPTASGKSKMAVKLAGRFGGEIISADSRQIYKGMDIGTGKITKKEMKSVPHYLLSVAPPNKKFTIVDYLKLAHKAINKIYKRGKLPIICGGTGFYIQALIDGIIIPKVKPDWRLRWSLGELSAGELFGKLKKLDKKRAKTIDKNNKRRLIRALEIAMKTKKPVPSLKKNPLPYPVLMLGIKKEREELKELIKRRLLKRLKQGMVAEVKRLSKSGVSWKRLNDFGLEYRYVARYLKSDFPNINFRKSDFFQDLQKEIEKYAKRQMTWFKRDKRIIWIKKQPEAVKLVKEFLEKK